MLCKQQVDIIIPVHNSGKYLSDCLKSIDNQEYNKINVIIINDGSNDESEKIINSYMHSSKFNVKYFAFQKPQGVSVARNKGIELSSGEFVTFVDSDDIILPNHVKTLVHNMTENVSLSAVYTSKSDLSRNMKGKSKVLSLSDSLISVLSSKGVEGYVWNKLFRNKFLQKYHIQFKQNIVMSEDLLFVCDYLLKVSGNMRMSSNQSYYYRKNNTSVTKSSSAEEARIQSQYLVYTLIEEMVSESSLNPKAVKVFYEKLMLFLNYALYRLGYNEQSQQMALLLKKLESKYLISFFMSSAIMSKEKMGYLYRKVKGGSYEP